MMPGHVKKSAIALSVALLLVVTMFATNVVSAHAAVLCGQCLTVQSVYTTDPNNNTGKTNFASGDAFWLHADVTSDAAEAVDVQFEVFDNDEDPSGYYYNQTDHAKIPVGLTRFYTPLTLPGSAASGEYTVRVTVTNSTNPDDTSYNANTMYVRSTSSTSAGMQVCTKLGLPENVCAVLTGQQSATQQEIDQIKQLFQGTFKAAGDAICQSDRDIIFGPNTGLANAVCGS